MRLPVKVVTSDGQEIGGPYLLRLVGWTEEQYFKEAPESQIVEFEDGDLIVPSPVNVRHQRIVGFLSFLLRGYVESHSLGEVLNGPGVVQLRPGLDYEPDIFVIATAQQDQVSEQYFAGAPALAIEVLSPSTRRRDLRTKAASYRIHSVPEYWAVDPERRILYQHRLPEAQADPYLIVPYTAGRLDSQAIGGFWLAVDWLWQEPLPRHLECLEQILSKGSYDS